MGERAREMERAREVAPLLVPKRALDVPEGPETNPATISRPCSDDAPSNMLGTA